MAKKKKRAQKPTTRSESAFGSSALAEQLSRAKITRKIEKAAAQDARKPAPSPKPEPLPPEQLLDGEELFMAALDAMPAPSARQKQRGTSAFHGEFARQLQGHRPIEQRRDPPKTTEKQDILAQDEPRNSPHSAPDTQPDMPLDADALFAHAVDTIQPGDLFAGKYHGSIKNLPRDKEKPAPFTASSAPAPHNQKKSKAERLADEERARAELSELREELMFTRAVGGFDEVFSNQDKYHRQTPRTYQEREERTAYSSESPEGLITPPLPKSGEGLHKVPPLDASQRGLLNRARLWARKEQMQALNVRGDGVEDALRQVELFIHQQWKDGARYVRIVHGRGLQSEEGVPVLKPSILHWLEGPGFRYVRGYAPELTPDHDYGSVIVCLTQRASRDKEQ